ncbi:MAG TPA: crossover junction endodeoxyribonuclease RuvC [Smithellaceae bacterium]|nr:crossover junction endodeoxyribonuclease RuvC [Smithellaceae bacterium]
MRILGIDPGSQITGYAVIEKEGSLLRHIAHGEIRPRKKSLLSEVLISIHRQLSEVIRDATPDAIAVEDIFYGKNVRSLIKQAEVRGLVIFTGADQGIPVFEYSPLEVKQAVVGYGRAEKKQVQIMVKVILKLSSLPPADAADALAVAVCHANFCKEQPIR